jgi:nitroreductase
MKRLIGGIMQLIKLLYELFKYKTLRRIKFWFYNSYDIRKSDDELLITRICYEGHHLEKAIKHSFSENLGKDRANRLKKMIEEAKKRNLKQEKIIYWAEELLDKFALRQQEKSRLISQCDAITIPSNGNTVIKAILSRKSIRFWLPKLVNRDLVEKIIEAGMNGPSSCNRQAIKVGVKENTVNNIIFGESNNKSMFSKAPLILYIAVDKRLYQEKYACALDAGSFCANALLVVEALGLGGCWIYQCESANQKDLRKQFNLPKYYYFYSALLIGYPAEVAEKPLRNDVKNVIANFHDWQINREG